MAAVIIVVLLVSLHLFTSNGFESPGQSGKLISRNRREQPQSKTNDAKIEKLQEDMKDVKSDIKSMMGMLQQIIPKTASFQSYRGDETTGTPEPVKPSSIVTATEPEDRTNSKIINPIEKQINNLESKVDEMESKVDKIKIMVSKTLRIVKEIQGENDTAETSEPQEQSTTVSGGTNSTAATIKAAETRASATTAAAVAPTAAAATATKVSEEEGTKDSERNQQDKDNNSGSARTFISAIYVLIVLVLLMMSYIIYVNRQTIKACILPGKNKDKSKSTTNYEKLKKDDEVTLLEKKTKTKASSYAY